MSRTVAVRLDQDTEEKLNYITRSSAISETELTEEAIRVYSAGKEAFVKAVKQGQDDVAAGRVISHDALVADLSDRLERVK